MPSRLLSTVKGSVRLMPTDFSGTWAVTMEPFPVDEDRISPSMLEDRLREASVSLRGWDFPHMGNDYGPIQDGLAGEIDWTQYHERWRLRTSGLFTYSGKIREDYTVRYMNKLSMVSTLWFLTEIWEFGRRLYGIDSTVDQIRVSLDLDGLEARALLVDAPDSGWGITSKPSKVPAFHKSKTLSRRELMSSSREVAVGWGESLFHAMGGKVSNEALAEIQGRLFRLGAGSE